MKHHLYSTEQLWELDWNTRTHTHTHTHTCSARIARTHTLTPFLIDTNQHYSLKIHSEATQIQTRPAGSYLHSSRVHSSVLRRKSAAVTEFCSLILCFLSFSVTPRLHMSGMCLHSHICELQCGEGQSQRHRWHPDGDR